MKQIKYLIFTLILTCLIFISKSVPTASGQDFATGINPPILFIEAEAPANISAPITIENQSDQTITYGIYLRPFKANSEGTGVPNYEINPSSEYEEFLENVQVQDEGEDITAITLGPRQSRELVLKINVEENAPPVDRYFTVVFLSTEPEEDEESSAVGARGGIGTNVLLTIGPKSEPTGRIATLSTPKLVTKGPVPVELEVANHNDYYVITEGNVLIENVFGHTVGNIEFGPLSILGNSNRVISSENEPESVLVWDEKYPVGFYTVKANVALSEKGPLLTTEATFFAFPIELALILGVIILVFIWIVRTVRKRISEDEKIS